MKLVSKTGLLWLVIAVIVIGIILDISTKDIKQWFEKDKVAVSQDGDIAESQDIEPEVGISPIPSRLELTEVRQMVMALPTEQQKDLLSNPEVFGTFIHQQQAQKAMLRLLMADGVKENSKVQFLMQKSAEKALLDWYLNQLILKNLASDFPNDDQVKEFYEQNLESFVIGERIHLWQIFLPVAKDANKNDRDRMNAQAQSIRNDIVNGNISFADAALNYSKNSPSRENGGYFGLVKLEELPEDIKQQVLSLEIDEVSLPITTIDGVHIIKHGAQVAEQAVELSQIKPKIREVLRNQAVENIRRSLIEEAQKKYPTNISEQDVEEWRLKLRSGL